MTAKDADHIITVAEEMQHERKDRFNNNLNLFMNKVTDELDAPASPNFIYATVSQLVSTMLNEDPHWVARADRRGYERQEQLLPSLLSKIFRTAKITRQLRQVLLSSIIFDFGAIKLGMGSAYLNESQEEKVEMSRAKAQQESMQMLAGSHVPVEKSDMHEIELTEHYTFLESPILLSHPAADAAIEALQMHIREHQEQAQAPHTPSTDFDSYKQPDFPFVKAVMPIDLYWEPGHMFFDEANWCAHGTWHRKKDLLTNPLFNKSVVKDLSAETLDGDFEHLYPDGEWKALQQHDDDLFRVWEIWNWRTKTRSIRAAGQKKPLYESDWPYYFINKFPFNTMVLSHAPGRPHGKAPLHYMEHNQRLEMDIMEAIAVHIKRSVPKYEVDADLLQKKEQVGATTRALRDGSHGGIIWTSKGGDAGKRAIIPVATASMDPTNLNMLQLLERARPVNSGLSDQAQGVTTGATATETQLAASGTNIRLNDYLSIVGEFVQWTGQTVLQMYRQFAPDSMDLRITMGRTDVWEEFKKTDLFPFYDLEVYLPQPGDERRRAADMQNVTHMMAQIPMLAGMLDWEQVGIELFSSMMPGHTDTDRFFQQNNRKEMVLIENEHRLMQTGQSPEVVDTHPHQLHLQMHQQFAQQAMQALQTNPQPEIQEMLAPLVQIMQQHLQEHQVYLQSPLVGRNRDARPNKTGNEGKNESISSARASGG